MNNITIINACSDLGVTVDGSSLGPKILTNDIVKHKIINVETGFKIKELAPDNKQKNLNAVNYFNKQLYNSVIDVINNNCFPFIIGRRP